MANELTPRQAAITAFKNKLTGTYSQDLVRKAVGNNAGAFTASLMELFSSDTQLQGCDPGKVIMEAVKAASMHLPINKQLGYGYIVVYKNWDRERRVSVPTPTFIIGYKGLIQLAIRSAQYKLINADIVFDGMLQGRDRLTGAIDLSGEPTEPKRIVGYFAHFVLTNGFTKTLYMSLTEMAAYALRYSPTFKRKNDVPTVEQLCDKAQKQYDDGSQGVGWENCFNDMAIKTVTRRLLSRYGYLSIEMQNAVIADERASEDAQAVELRDETNAAPKPAFDAAQYAEAREVQTKDADNPYA